MDKKKKKEKDEKPGFVKLYERDKARDQANAKLFNVDELLQDSSKIKEIYIEKINAKVKFCVLTFAELLEITGQKTSNEDKAVMLLNKMLNKADPKITLEKTRRLPAVVAMAIFEKLGVFLPR